MGRETGWTQAAVGFSVDGHGVLLKPSGPAHFREATAMVEDVGGRLDTRGIMPTPELPTLRQPLFVAWRGRTGHTDALLEDLL